MAPASAADCAQRAASLAAASKDAEADALFEQGLAQFPDDARLANSAGNFHARARRDERALALFERAIHLDPALSEAALNAAIVLLRLGRPGRAEAFLVAHEIATSAQYWALRSDAAKALGDFAAADGYLGRAEALEPSGQRSLPRKARLSLERGDLRAVEAHASALAAQPGDFALMEGYVLALQAGGQAAEARDFAEALTAHFPAWSDGQVVLAELRWAAGEADYAGHFANAAAAHAAPETYLAWASMLSGNDHHADAAEVLERGLRLWPEDAQLRLQRAVALGEAGDAAQADAILAASPGQHSHDWQLARSRNDLRLGRIDSATTTLERLVDVNAADVAAWSLLDLCWRLTGDTRHAWLHGQSGLVRELALPLDRARWDAIRDTLRRLHASSPIPLAQSVKGGTQTRGALFARTEPELAVLKDALQEVLSEYRHGLPAADPAHPLLSRRDARWMIAGNWSVRFTDSGRHAAHIHPQGLLSSACYVVVPEEIDEADRPGWLELGRPPEGIAPELGPLHAIKPREGCCALFPSTLFHGTRPIGAGERMTVAFDVVAWPD